MARLELPAGEAASAWASPAELAGLRLGPGGVQVVVTPGQWQLRVESPEGLRSAWVTAPRSPKDREAVALLAASLLRQGPQVGGTAMGLAPLPPPAPAPTPTPIRRAPAPAPTAREEPPATPPVVAPMEPPATPPAVADAPAVPLAAPSPPAPIEPTPPVAPPEPAAWGLALTSGLRLRAGMGASPEVALSALWTPGPWSLGLRVSAGRAFPLTEALRLGLWEVGPTLSYQPQQGRLRPHGGLGLGVQAWTLKEASYAPQRALGLAPRVDLGLLRPLGAHLSAGLLSGLAVDLRPVDIEPAVDDPGRLALRVGLGLEGGW